MRFNYSKFDFGQKMTQLPHFKVHINLPKSSKYVILRIFENFLHHKLPEI